MDSPRMYRSLFQITKITKRRVTGVIPSWSCYTELHIPIDKFSKDEINGLAVGNSVVVRASVGVTNVNDMKIDRPAVIDNPNDEKAA